MVPYEKCRAAMAAALEALTGFFFWVYAPFALLGNQIAEYFARRRRRKDEGA